MGKKELAIKLNCPRAYETATKYWEDSGVEDHCAGCGGTKAEHTEEVNRIIQEQSDKIDYTCCDCGCSEFSFRSIYGPGVPEVRIEFCDACGMRKPATYEISETAKAHSEGKRCAIDPGHKMPDIYLFPHEKMPVGYRWL